MYIRKCFHFYLRLAVIWTSIDKIVNIPSKLCLVEKWVHLDNEKGVKLKKAISIIFLLFFRLNLQISLTGVHPHITIGRDIEFGDTQEIGILKFVSTPYFLDNHE